MDDRWMALKKQYAIGYKQLMDSLLKVEIETVRADSVPELFALHPCGGPADPAGVRL